MLGLLGTVLGVLAAPAQAAPSPSPGPSGGADGHGVLRWEAHTACTQTGSYTVDIVPPTVHVAPGQWSAPMHVTVTQAKTACPSDGTVPPPPVNSYVQAGLFTSAQVPAGPDWASVVPSPAGQAKMTDAVGVAMTDNNNFTESGTLTVYGSANGVDGLRTSGDYYVGIALATEAWGSWITVTTNQPPRIHVIVDGAGAGNPPAANGPAAGTDLPSGDPARLLPSTSPIRAARQRGVPWVQIIIAGVLTFLVIGGIVVAVIAFRGRLSPSAAVETIAPETPVVPEVPPPVTPTSYGPFTPPPSPIGPIPLTPPEPVLPPEPVPNPFGDVRQPVPTEPVTPRGPVPNPFGRVELPTPTEPVPEPEPPPGKPLNPRLDPDRTPYPTRPPDPPTPPGHVADA